MSLPAPAPRRHLHTRTIRCDGYLRDDGLWDIEAQIVDTKAYRYTEPFRGVREPGSAVHDMIVRLTVDSTMTVRDIAVSIEAHPYATCLEAVPAFQSLIGARIGGGAGAVFTDFRVHADGFSRFLISDTHLGARQAGRMLQRLFEIDTYRMLAFLALPLAKSLSPQLSDADRELTAITLQMSNAAQEDEPLLLDQLTKLAAKIEASLSASDYRFSAAHAYYSIVERRISELRESRMQGMQPFREFMERRLTPAMDTCESISRRQRMLAERIDRASDLLRTRVDITREQQNQQLLEQMNKRSQLQLRLQETVEGLSVAAITYYSVGLVGYASKGLKSLGVPLNPDMAMGLAIPLIAGSVWYSIRAMRKVVAQEMGHH